MNEEIIAQIKIEISAKIDNYIESLTTANVAREIANKVFARYDEGNVQKTYEVIIEYVDELMR